MRWKDGATIDVHAEMMQLTRSIVSRCLFGSDLEPGDEEIEPSSMGSSKTLAS